MKGRAVLRLGLAAFLADMSMYLMMTGVPYRALAFGAGALALGLIPVARGVPYSVSTVWAGQLTERGDRLRAARITVGTAVLAALGLVFVSNMAGIFALLVLLGFAMAFYWPAVQAALADLKPEGVAKSLGWFNMAWSSGKATGFLLGGAILAGLGFPALFIASAVGLCGVLALIAAPLPKRDHAASSVAVSPVPERARAFRRAGWVANAIAYGIATVLNIHYPHWLKHIGRGEVLLGTYLGVVFFSQTLTFYVLTHVSSWHHRVAPLICMQLPMVLMLVALPFLHHAWAILATAPLVGLGLGIAYFASLYYSVEAPLARGRNAGAHEAILTLGSLFLPLAAGLLASTTHHLEYAYFLSAAVGGAGLVAQGLMLRGRTG